MVNKLYSRPENEKVGPGQGNWAHFGLSRQASASLCAYPCSCNATDINKSSYPNRKVTGQIMTKIEVTMRASFSMHAYLGKAISK